MSSVDGYRIAASISPVPAHKYISMFYARNNLIAIDPFSFCQFGSFSRRANGRAMANLQWTNHIIIDMDYYYFICSNPDAGARIEIRRGNSQIDNLCHLGSGRPRCQLLLKFSLNACAQTHKHTHRRCGWLPPARSQRAHRE